MSISSEMEEILLLKKYIVKLEDNKNVIKSQMQTLLSNMAVLNRKFNNINQLDTKLKTSINIIQEDNKKVIIKQKETNEKMDFMLLRMKGMVEEQMRQSMKHIADLWFTCWVNAGKPSLQDVKFKEVEIEEEKIKEGTVKSREHAKTGSDIFD
jgi:hypothetical protein